MPEQNSPAPSKSVWQEITTPGYMGRARARAQFRKSPWNLVLIPIWLAGTAAITYGSLRTMWIVHTLMYPEHIGHLGEFWGNGISGGAFISSFLLLMPLLFAAMAMSMMLTNCVGWCIPPARRAFEAEGRTAPWLSFPVAMRQLGQLSLFVVPIGLILSFIGAATLKSLRRLIPPLLAQARNTRSVVAQMPRCSRVGRTFLSDHLE